MRRWMFFALFFMGAIALYNVDSITGRWKFERMCRQSGGSHFYEPATEWAGWRVEGHDESAYKPPFEFESVDFVRYRSADGRMFDVRVNGYVSAGQRNYAITPADESKPDRYEYRFRNDPVAEYARLSRQSHQVIDLRSGRVVAEHVKYTYEWTTSDRVLLSGPTGVTCWGGKQDVLAFFGGIYSVSGVK